MRFRATADGVHEVTFRGRQAFNELLTCKSEKAESDHTVRAAELHRARFLCQSKYDEYSATAFGQLCRILGTGLLSVDEFVAKARELGFGGVMLMAKRPHVSILDYGERESAPRFGPGSNSTE